MSQQQYEGSSFPKSLLEFLFFFIFWWQPFWLDWDRIWKQFSLNFWKYLLPVYIYSFWELSVQFLSLFIDLKAFLYFVFYFIFFIFVVLYVRSKFGDHKDYYSNRSVSVYSWSRVCPACLSRINPGEQKVHLTFYPNVGSGNCRCPLPPLGSNLSLSWWLVLKEWTHRKRQGKKSATLIPQNSRALV